MAWKTLNTIKDIEVINQKIEHLKARGVEVDDIVDGLKLARLYRRAAEIRQDQRDAAAVAEEDLRTGTTHAQRLRQAMMLSRLYHNQK